MPSLIKTLIKETNLGSYRAEIYDAPSGMIMKCYSPSNELISEQTHKTYNLHYMEDLASNWFSGIKMLNE